MLHRPALKCDLIQELGEKTMGFKRKTMFVLLFLLLPLYVGYGRDYRWGVGIQGNYPLWGGISVKYMGFHPVHLLLIGRMYTNDNETEGTLAGAVSYILFEAGLFGSSQKLKTRTYLMCSGGLRYERRSWYISANEPPLEPNRFPISVKVDEISSTYGPGILVGTELIFFSRYGLNFEFGQGVWRVEEKTRYPEVTPVELEKLHLKPSDDKSELRVSLVFGFGFHVYF